MARRLKQLAELPVTTLNGVGDAKAKGLAKLDIVSVLDLLTYYPRRYLDRTNGSRTCTWGRRPWCSCGCGASRSSPHPTAPRWSSPRSPTGAVPSRSRSSTSRSASSSCRELEAVLFGKLEVFRGQRQMTNPVVDLIGDKTGMIVPVYPQSEKAGVMTWDIAKLMTGVLDREGEFEEPVPEAVRRARAHRSPAGLP